MIWRSIIIAGCLVLAGCASSKNAEEQAQSVNSTSTDNSEIVSKADTDTTDSRDPLEGVNRAVWAFNWDFLDKVLLRPAAVTYRKVLPQFVRRGVHNAALNLEEPSSSLNNLLQGELEGTAVSVGRFVINSTVGLLGTIDVAKEIGLERKPEEFGEVLGAWGITTGPYLMLPALGPNDLRTGSGKVVDNAYFPLADLNIYFSIFQSAVKVLEARADLIAQEELLNNSLDPYLFVKDAYFQRVQNKVNNGREQKQTEEEEEFNDELDAYLDGMND